MNSAIVEEIKNVISVMTNFERKVSPPMSCSGLGCLRIDRHRVAEAKRNRNNTDGQGPTDSGTHHIMTFILQLLKAMKEVLKRYGYLRILEVGAGNGKVKEFLMSLLSPFVDIEWVSTDLIPRSYAPDVVQMDGLTAVQNFTGFNLLLMLFPPPNDRWSTDVLEYLTNAKEDCAFIFGGETGYSDGDKTILDVLRNHWDRDFREVFARVDPSINILMINIARLIGPELAHNSADFGTNEKAIELYFLRSRE